MNKIKHLLCGLAIALSGCGVIRKHDKLVKEYQDTQEAWANIDATLQRRHDLIPALVSTVKGQVKGEEQTFTKVQEARSKATQIQLSAADLEDPAKLKVFQEAQGELSGALSKLMMVQESYPQLHQHEGFRDLRVQLEGTENRILRAREQYNKEVREYNTELQKVHGKVVNVVTGQPFAALQMYKASAGAQAAPTVDF